MSYLNSMARILCGDVGNRAKMQIVCPGPGHSPRDRSLSVFVDFGNPDGFRVHPHSPRDDWRECRDYVRDRLGLPNWAGPRTSRCGSSHSSASAPPSSRGRSSTTTSTSTTTSCAPSDRTPSDTNRTARAIAVWQDAGKLDGSPGMTWLFRRGVNLDELPRGLHGALRWHPACPWEGSRHPCMVGLFTDAVTGEPKAIHRTAVTPAGEKAGRKALGPIAGCVIRLWPDEEVELGVVVGEGIETTLALRALQEAVGEAGENPPASNHIPGSVRVVTVDMWRQYAYQRGISATDTGERARQQAFKRASEHLVAAGRVGIWGEHVWATQ